MNAQEAEIIERVELLTERGQCPQAVANGACLTTVSHWRAAAAMPGNHSNLLAQLAELEAADDRAHRFREAEAERDAARAQASQPDPALAAEVRREAEAAYRQHENERPKRVEELLSRAVELLSQLAKR